jgi:hypothetical protein
MSFVISFVSALNAKLFHHLNFGSLVYLLMVPVIIFYNGNWLYLVLSIFLAFLLWSLFERGNLLKLFFFLAVIALVCFFIKPHFGFSSGFLNIINTQRGEHLVPGILPKILHNKLDYVHIFIENFDRFLSPVSIFANGFWHNLNPYYPLGFLFPWDIFFLYVFISKRKEKTNEYFWIALFLLGLLTGLLYIDQAAIFALAVVYFFALLISQGYSLVNKKYAYSVLVLNLIYLIIEFNLLSYFHT